MVTPTMTRVAETNTRVVQTVRLMDGDSSEQNTANSPQSSGARSYSIFKGPFPCTPNARVEPRAAWRVACDSLQAM